MKLDKNGERRIGKRAYPLRKVVERGVPIEGFQYMKHVRLECGHVVKPSSDMYGDTSPESQRCRQCYDELTNRAMRP